MNGTYKEALLAARKDELEANARYAEMAAIAPSMTLSQIVSSIAADEYAHARIISSILATTNSPSIMAQTQMAPDVERFKRMVEAAIEGELGDVAEYANLALMAPNMQTRLLFLTILGDEYGHARAFIAMLNGLVNK